MRIRTQFRDKGPGGMVDMACCRLRGHEDKIVTKERESGHGETEVQP
jgi:hypothetical protein